MELEGLTGDITFNEEGRRINYTLHVVEMSVNSAMVKVAEWSDRTRFVSMVAKYVRHLHTPSEMPPNRTLIVTTILEEPYVMLVKRPPVAGGNGEEVAPLQGNQRFEGYCKDLADLVAERIGISCELLCLKKTNLVLIIMDSKLYDRTHPMCLHEKNVCSTRLCELIKTIDNYWHSINPQTRCASSRTTNTAARTNRCRAAGTA